MSVMLEVENLVKHYDAPKRVRKSEAHPAAVDGVSLQVEEGAFYTLLGPSGCGKTTILRSIAGLETPTSGSITLAGRKLYDSATRVSVRTEERGLGMVFQSYAIWPHMTVRENLEFVMSVGHGRRAGTSRPERASRIDSALEVVGLAAYASRPATNLSGGQQQRLALARALVIRPPLLLLDEPLSNLDAQLRETMRLELKRLQRELGITTVYVTHDQTEALVLSNRIAVLNAGQLEQVGTPREIYDEPCSRFVASFVGTTNLIDGRIESADASNLCQVVTGALGLVTARLQVPASAGSEVTVVARPEDFHIEEAGDVHQASAENEWIGEVVSSAYMGETTAYLVRVGGEELQARAAPTKRIRVGSRVRMSAPAGSLRVVPR